MTPGNTSGKTPGKTPAATNATGPDIRQLRDRDLPQGRFPGDARVDFRVFIEPRTHTQVHKHAEENVGVEICGVLVGRWGRDDKGPFLTISESIRGEAATNKFAEVTFTHETWSKINAQMDKEFAGYLIVGWYHTHPDFGIFLSDRDRFIHEHFFNEPGQVALVVDPVRKEEGLFTWSGGKAVPAPYYWVGDKLKIAKISDDGDARDHKGKGESGSSASKDKSQVPLYDRPIIGNLTMVLGAMLLLMLGWMLHQRLIGMEGQKFLEMVQIERLRLNVDLTAARQSLERAVLPLNDVMVRNPDIFNKPEVRSAMGEAATNLHATASQLDAIRGRYGIDVRELSQMAVLLSQQLAELEELQKRDNPTTEQSTTQPSTTEPATAAPVTVPGTQPAR